MLFSLVFSILFLCLCSLHYVVLFCSLCSILFGFVTFSVSLYVTGRPYSQVITERSAANVYLFKSSYENNCQELKFLRREEKDLEFVFENDYFPDTNSVVEREKIFEENSKDAAAAVKVEEKEVDDLELDTKATKV